jgi:hypothetical protein
MKVVVYSHDADVRAQVRLAIGRRPAMDVPDEIYNCPPALLIIGRADDGWLATWSRADAVVSHPIDPIALAHELAGLMRERPAVSG